MKNKLTFLLLSLLFVGCVNPDNTFKYRTITYEITKGSQKDTVNITLYTDSDVKVIQNENGYRIKAHKTTLYFKEPIRLINVSGNEK